MQRLFFPLVLLTALITACGGARQEPFNPSDPKEPEREPVAWTSLVSGTAPFVDSGGKRLELMTNVDDYYDVLEQYTDVFITEPNFNLGQVLLYDGGPTDDNVCVHKLILRRLEAATLNEDVVEVTLVYEDFVPQTGPNCDDDVIDSRPYEFFYIQSRAEVVINERLQGTGTSSSSSSRSSSSSSSSSSSAP